MLFNSAVKMRIFIMPYAVHMVLWIVLIDLLLHTKDPWDTMNPIWINLCNQHWVNMAPTRSR